jgi:hypothetical protein
MPTSWGDPPVCFDGALIWGGGFLSRASSFLSEGRLIRRAERSEPGGGGGETSPPGEKAHTKEVRFS